MTDSMTTINSVHVFTEQQAAVSSAEVERQLNEHNGNVFVFYSHPSVFVAAQLEQGSNGDDACRDWLTHINDALLLQRKNRRRIRLLCLQNALEHPQALQQHTDLNAEELSGFNVQPQGLQLIAGHQLVLQNDEIMPLIERLEALTLQLSERAYHVTVDVESVLATTAESANRVAETSEQLKKTEEENELLLLQLQQVQEELEETFISKKEQENALKKELSELKARTEKYEQGYNELKEEKAQLVDQNQKLKAEKNNAVESDKLNEAEEENELLLLQLQQVQEELETYFIKYQEASKQLAEQNHSTRQLHTDNATTLRENEPPKQQVEKLKNPPKRTLTQKIKRRLGLGKKQNKEQARIKKNSKLLEKSEYFDATWYLNTYPDVAKAEVNPAEHYLRFGGFEERNPSDKFDSAFYLITYPDVAETGVNPLLHFELYGKQEGRLPKS